MIKEVEYNGYRLIARENEKGWQVEIVSMKPGQPNQTMPFGELEDALDEARKFIDFAG
jgi:hypothetical protein